MVYVTLRGQLVLFPFVLTSSTSLAEFERKVKTRAEATEGKKKKALIPRMLQLDALSLTLPIPGDQI